MITDNSGILAEGSCGKDVSYCLYNDGSMVISGQGEMENYMEGTAPWSDHNDDITSIYVDCGVTGIGEYAFCNCTNLEEVTVSEFMNPDDTFSIDTNAFANCSQLSKVELPDIAYDISTNTFDETSHIQICSNSGSVETYCAGFDNLSLHKHDMKYVATTRATCMEVGYDSYACDCGYEEISNVIQATTKHSFVEVEREEAKQNEDGYVKYQCSGCADTYYETLKYEEPGDKSPDASTDAKQDIPAAGDVSSDASSGANQDIPAVGTQITTSFAIYTVTKSTALKTIGASAFYGNKNLKTITIKSTKLTSKRIGKNAFKGTNKKLTIKVPKKKVSSYKKFFKKKGNKYVKVKK